MNGHSASVWLDDRVHEWQWALSQIRDLEEAGGLRGGRNRRLLD
jgi:hypothetical protein